MKNRKSEFKPLSFSTTMRNPERIASFLDCLLPYDGFILSNEIIDKVSAELIKTKLYVPAIVNKDKQYKEIYNSEEYFDTETANKIKELSPQNHKEAGFDKGWPSRFDTWYKLPMEFGFVFYEMGKSIKISSVGHKLINIYKNSENKKEIQYIFLNALMKYQTDNPFRKNKNSNVPLLLLLNVIKLLNGDKQQNGKGINRREIPFILCCPNNDYVSVYQKIAELRKEYGYKYSDEIIYKICFDMLGATEKDETRFKMSQITGELVDEFIRKVRITGIVSLRGNGRFLDFNEFEKDKIDYIINNYSDYENFSKKTKKEYFDYISEIDNNILKEEIIVIKDKENVKEKTLADWAENYKKSEIIEELKITCGKRNSSHPILKYIDKPTRFEFLTSILLKQTFKSVKVLPNYSVDDEGLPTFTASGGMADIECFDTDNNSLFEVTLLTNRSQSVNEIPAITRHLQEAKNKYSDKFVFSVFIAPNIHQDTIYMTEFSKSKYNVDIIPLSADNFINKLIELKCIRNLVN